MRSFVRPNQRIVPELQRRTLLQRRQSFRRGILRPPLLEPASAEFISALAAGINSRHILQIGCGLSTLTLAAGCPLIKMIFSVDFPHILLLICV